MKIYGIGALGADRSVFRCLRLNQSIEFVDWLQPETHESVEQYARRLSEQINTSERFGLIGVCFGGILAVELSKILQPEVTILISSAETRHDLRWAYRVLGRTGLVKVVPNSFFYPPKAIRYRAFGARNKALFDHIVSTTEVTFVRWAIQAMLSWKNTTPVANACLKIGGSDDLIMPQRAVNTIRIENSGHMTIVDQARETSRIINEWLREFEPTLSNLPSM